MSTATECISSICCSDENVNRYPSFNPRTMKMYRAGEVIVQTFFTLDLEGRDCSVLLPGRLTPRERAPSSYL